MASFDYRLNPLYKIKECSTYGAMYTTDCCCSNVGSVDKFIRDPNPISYDETPDSPSQPQISLFNQRHCFHCKDPLEEHEHCKRCTCMRCGSGLSKGLCLICASRYGNNPNPNSLNDSPNISENVSQSPPHIDHHCCYECGDSLDDIFCQRCTCKSCGNGAHYGYNCPPKVPFIYNPEPCNNQTVDELPQTLPSFDPTCYSGDGSSFTYDSTPNFINDSPNVFNPPPQPPTDFQQVMDDSMSKLRETFQTWLQQRQEQVVNLDSYTPEPSQCWKIPICYDDDDDEYSFATQEYLKKFSSAITPDLPKLDSPVMEDEHLDTIPKTESDELIKSSVEDLVHTPSESDGISEGECDLPVCDDSSLKKDEVLDDIISIPQRNGNDHFNAESSPSESMLNRDNVISSPKIDLLIEEFAGELALLAPIPPGIVEANLDPKEDIRFIENLMYDNSFPRPPETLKDDSETVIDSNNDYSSSDDDSYEDIDYVDASPPDSELASLEVVEIVIPEVGGIDTDILLTIKDDILREKLLNVNLLIAKIGALKDNPTPSSDFVTKSSSTSPNFFLEETNTFDNSLPESETFCFNLEEKSSGKKSSGSTTTHADFSQYDSFIFDLSINPFPPADRSDFYHEEFAGELAHIISPSEYDHFYFKIEPDSGNFTMDVVEDIFDNPTREPRVHVPNVVPTHPTLHLDSDFTLSSDSLGSDLAVSFPSGTRNKIFDPGIFIGVQSMRFLSLDEFSISFIRDLPFPVIDTFLPFSSENEDKVVNTGILAAGEEQSPHLSSHRGLKALNESPMMIHGENTPNLGVRHLHFYPP
ncbi:hypothetical protein Tco_1178141 [Tanacetum coccineum]